MGVQDVDSQLCIPHLSKQMPVKKSSTLSINNILGDLDFKKRHYIDIEFLIGSFCHLFS